MSTPTARRLELLLDERRVGELREQGNVWALAYDPAWQASGFDLAPGLPRAEGELIDGASHRPVQWFFDNLLPEEGARTLLAQDAGLDAADAFGLLTRFGPESAGALTLLSAGQTLEEAKLRPLADAELSARIRNLPRVPLDHAAPKRMSLAGAQHKLPVVELDGQLWEPVGRAASSHLLKPDHERRDDYPHSAANEWFCMQLAHACGLLVPSVALRRVPEPVYLVRRFDRAGDGLDARRLHALDACQLLSLDRIYKYSQASVERLVELIDLCRRPGATRLALLRWHCFNLMIGNGDAHLKNLSALVTSAGIELAPHYDLLSTAIYVEAGWGSSESVIPTGGEQKLARIGRAHVLAFAAALGVPERVAARHVQALVDAILPAAVQLLGRAEASTLPGEARLLRQIVHGPIADMTRQLR